MNEGIKTTRSHCGYANGQSSQYQEKSHQFEMDTESSKNVVQKVEKVVQSLDNIILWWIVNDFFIFHSLKASWQSFHT